MEIYFAVMAGLFTLAAVARFTLLAIGEYPYSHYNTAAEAVGLAISHSILAGFSYYFLWTV